MRPPRRLTCDESPYFSKTRSSPPPGTYIDDDDDYYYYYNGIYFSLSIYYIHLTIIETYC